MLKANPVIIRIKKSRNNGDHTMAKNLRRWYDVRGAFADTRHMTEKILEDGMTFEVHSPILGMASPVLAGFRTTGCMHPRHVAVLHRNRRMRVLLIHQAVHRDRVVMAFIADFVRTPFPSNCQRETASAARPNHITTYGHALA